MIGAHNGAHNGVYGGVYHRVLCVTLRPAGLKLVLHERVRGQVLVAEVELHLLHDRRPRLVGKNLRGGWSPRNRPMSPTDATDREETARCNRERDRRMQQRARPADATESETGRCNRPNATDATDRPRDRPTPQIPRRTDAIQETGRRHKTGRCNAPRERRGWEPPGEGRPQRTAERAADGTTQGEDNGTGGEPRVKTRGKEDDEGSDNGAGVYDSSGPFELHKQHGADIGMRSSYGALAQGRRCRWSLRERPSGGRPDCSPRVGGTRPLLPPTSGTRELKSMSQKTHRLAPNRKPCLPSPLCTAYKTAYLGASPNRPGQRQRSATLIPGRYRIAKQLCDYQH